MSCASTHDQFIASDKKDYRTHMDCLSELYSNVIANSLKFMSDKVTKHHFENKQVKVNENNCKEVLVNKYWEVLEI
jgi:hypothetical protein